MADRPVRIAVQIKPQVGIEAPNWDAGPVRDLIVWRDERNAG